MYGRFGGAIGDAFGYTVEVSNLAQIRKEYGHAGLTQPQFISDRLVVSDDTQMTLFTAEGLMRALTSEPHAGKEWVVAEIRKAYLDWLTTQSGREFQPGAAGLLGQKTLWARRAPGNTCLAALREGGHGTPEQPINNSKGCGGIMRVAPIGLLRTISADEAFEIAVAAAALTHGHPSGYLSAGALAGMIRDFIGDMTLVDSLALTRDRLMKWKGHEEVLLGIDRAGELAKQRLTDHPAAIRQLGEGWVGDEALSIGLYAASVAGSFHEAIVIASNHDGDSDSTASIAGQLWGATRGIGAVRSSWATRLDVFDAVLDSAEGILKLDDDAPKLDPERKRKRKHEVYLRWVSALSTVASDEMKAALDTQLCGSCG